MKRSKIRRPLREVAHLRSHILVQDKAGRYYLRPAMWFGVNAFLRPISREKVYEWLGVNN